MSYILDALNKSEQERARKHAPGLAALHGDQDRTPFTLKHFLLILLILITVNFIGLYLLFGDRLHSETESVVQTEPPVTNNVETQDPAEAQGKRLIEEPELITPSTAMAKSLRTQEEVENYEVMQIDELPRATQMRLPAIDITTHIYGSDAELRMVRIDGEPRYEGDILATDFRLLEITETGIVLEFEGYAYAFDIIDTWLEP